MGTIKEIARLAGVSRGTVDRVLNERGDVNPETAQRVKRVADSLNYSPNLAGKTLAVRKKHLRFGYILFSSTTSNPFFLDIVQGIENRAAELAEFGVTVDIRYARIDTPDLQVTLIDELVSSGVVGLAITPTNHPAVVSRIRNLAETGFPVITVNTDIHDCGRLSYVGEDSFKIGETAAGLMNLITAGLETKVGIVIGHPSVESHTERAGGFTQRALTHYPKLSVVATVKNHDDNERSLAVVKQLLQDHPEIDALYLASGGIAGACQAVEEAGRTRQLKMICHDLTPTTRKMIRENVVAATLTQEPFLQGTKPLDILFNYVGLGIRPESDQFFTKIEIKLRENI